MDLFVRSLPHSLPFPLPNRGVPSFFKLAGEVGKVGGEARGLGVEDLLDAGFFAELFFPIFLGRNLSNRY